MINEHITHYSCKNKVIPDNQYGFEHNHSTVHAIHKLLNDIYNHINNGKLVGATLIDLEKAFDSVWINGLIATLHKYNISLWLTYNIIDMISNKKFITWNGSKAKPSFSFSIIEGLQQGTVNSPILFNIFASNIINQFGVNSNDNTHSIAFADDLIM